MHKAGGGDPAEIKRWLNQLIARNQSDFFSHKRLKDSLTGDLNVFIKIEVLDVDQLMGGSDLPQRMIKVGRVVGKSGAFQMELPDDVNLQAVKTVTPEPNDFLVHIAGKRWLEQINKVKLSLTAAVYTSAISRDGVRTEKGTMGQDMTGVLKKRLIYVDRDRLDLELVEMKRQKGWWNFSFDFDAIHKALSSNRYELWGIPFSLRVETDADIIRLNRTAATLVRRLFESAYRREENRNSRYTWVDASESWISKIYRKERLHVQN